MSESVRPGWGRVCVIGAGKTGIKTCEYIAGHLGKECRSCHLFPGEKDLEPSVAERLRSLGVRVHGAGTQVEGWYDLGIASPGISEFSDFAASLKGHCAEVVSEPEFAWQASPQRWIAITGTNGKTTTTSLVAHLLRKAAVDAVTVGNIGNLCCEAVGSLREERGFAGMFVAELSSFQLALTDRFHPEVAVLLNVTADHLSWHKGFENYVQAKARIFRNLDAGDLAVVGSDEVCQRLAHDLIGRGLRVCMIFDSRDGFEASGFSRLPDFAYTHQGRLWVSLDGVLHQLGEVGQLPLQGAHNRQDMLAAAVCALFEGASVQQVRAGLKEFRPLEHRIEPCGQLSGVTFVNDSKATNADATIKALSAFQPGRLVLLLGGHDKGTDLDQLVRAASAAAHDVVCFGEAAPRFLHAFAALDGSGKPGLHRADRLEQAVRLGFKLARPGDSLLLSPACSSFDQFSGYEQRGRAFKELVAQLRPEDGVNHE